MVTASTHLEAEAWPDSMRILDLVLDVAILSQAAAAEAEESADADGTGVAAEGAALDRRSG